MSSAEIVMQDIASRALDDAKGRDIRVFDIREIADFADYMLIASGTSDRHVKALADSVQSALRECEIKPIGVEGDAEGDWILLDYGDLIVHCMQQQTRDFYDLESLWGEQMRAMLRVQRQRRAD